MRSPRSVNVTWRIVPLHMPSRTETLFTLVLTAIDPFDSECITESLDRFQKCDAVLVDVGRRLLSVPFESLLYL